MTKNRRYRIKTPTIAMFCSDGERRTVTVLVNEIVTLAGDLRDGDRLVDVVWNGEDCLMFTQDLRDRTDEVDRNFTEV